MIVRRATIEDKKFIIKANNEINKITDNKTSNYLQKNFESDLQNNDTIFLIIEESGKEIAMCIYSYTYWATHGKGVYISNIYVEKKYRKMGILTAILNYLETTVKNIKFVYMYTGYNNKIMQAALPKLGYVREDMYIYSKSTK